MKILSRILLGLALASPLTVASAVSADDKSPPSSDTSKQDVTMDQLPKPVKTTVQRESKGKNIESMTKSTDKNGVVAYEFKYLDGNKETTLGVATNGKVLAKQVRDAAPAQPNPPSQSNPPPSDSNPPPSQPNAPPSQPNPPRPNDTSSPNR
jgi:hypothetical protein